MKNTVDYHTMDIITRDTSDCEKMVQSKLLEIRNISSKLEGWQIAGSSAKMLGGEIGIPVEIVSDLLEQLAECYDELSNYCANYVNLFDAASREILE